MNVFDELIDELKEEHLIETNTGEFSEKRPKKEADRHPETADGDLFGDIIIDDAGDELSELEIMESEAFLETLADSSANPDETPVEITPNVAEDDILEISQDQFVVERNGDEAPPVKKKRIPTPFERFRKKMLEQVSSLQMVDNIFSSVEREQIKTNAKPFDDLPLKKILHEFVKLPPATNVDDCGEFQDALTKQMSMWEMALASRDQKISIENLRYCCENTRPPLSPPALLALAKFYRNAKFSENNRNKFELIITRLFATDVEDNKRELVFSQEELVEHLSELYLEWKSPPTNLDEEASERINSLLARFDEMLREARSTRDFDDLIDSEFFNRVRILKRSTAELFFSPQIAATAIICNVQIGNRYIDLLRYGQERSIAETIEDKYSFIFDSTISEATNKSVEIAEIIRTIRENPGIGSSEDCEGLNDPSRSRKTEAKESFFSSKFFNVFSVNRWVLGLTILSLVLSAALVLWVEVFSAPLKRDSDVKAIEFEKTPFKNFIESGRVTSDTLFVIATPEFEGAPREKKEEIARKLVAEGEKKGYKKVHLLNSNSQTVGFATDSTVEIK